MTPEQGIKLIEQQFRSVTTRLPIIVGNEAVNFTLDNFKRQGFLGATFQPWMKRKVMRKGSNNNGAILIHIGRLRRGNRILFVQKDAVMIGNDVPYAKAHNEGLRIGLIESVKGFTRKSGVEVKAHTRKVNMDMPKRQFMGNSPYLNMRIKRVAVAAYVKEIKELKA
jgi:phage gpG-like protein